MRILISERYHAFLTSEEIELQLYSTKKSTLENVEEEASKLFLNGESEMKKASNR